MNIYIDESGDLGAGNISQKKGRFFILAALVPQTRSGKRLKNIIKRSCIEFGTDGNVLSEIHGTLLKFEQKEKIMRDFNKENDFYCSYIATDLKYVDHILLENNNILYNYLFKLLFKQFIKEINEDIYVIIDERSTKVKGINSLPDYIKTEAWTSWKFTKKIDFERVDSKEVRLIQAVDLISNVIWQHYSYKKDHIYNLISQRFKNKIHFPFKKFGK